VTLKFSFCSQFCNDIPFKKDYLLICDVILLELSLLPIVIALNCTA